jgi:predicted transcriptional regulator YheO
MNRTISKYLSVAEGVQKLFYPHVEVVLHDIKQNKVAAIFNPYSKRVPGDDSLLTKEELAFTSDVIGPYVKRNWDGRKLKSISCVLRDERNDAVGLMCFNFDVSVFLGIADRIHDFISIIGEVEQPESLFKDDWQEKINKYVHSYLAERQLTLDTIKRQDKKRLIEHLSQQGAFKVKNAAQYIASVIGVSRATVYNYLNAVNGKTTDVD